MCMIRTKCSTFRSLSHCAKQITWLHWHTSRVTILCTTVNSGVNILLLHCSVQASEKNSDASMCVPWGTRSVHLQVCQKSMNKRTFWLTQGSSHHYKSEDFLPQEKCSMFESNIKIHSLWTAWIFIRIQSYSGCKKPTRWEKRKACLFCTE